MCASNGASAPCMTLAPRRSGVASPIICRSALAIAAHRGVASLANTARYWQGMPLAVASDGRAQATTSDPGRGPEELARSFDLLVIDHPFIGQAERTGCFRDLRELIAAPVLSRLTAQGAGP